MEKSSLYRSIACATENLHPKRRKAVNYALLVALSSAVAACGGDSTSNSADNNDNDNIIVPAPGDNITNPEPKPVFKDNYSPVGVVSQPFAEPIIMVDGEAVPTDQNCIELDNGELECKPSAGTIAVLPDDRFLFLNALEGTENVELSIVAEFGEVSVNDQSRVLSLDEDDNPSFLLPSPLRAGANPDGNESNTLLRGTPLDGALDTADNTAKNDGALFCSDVIGTPTGKVMAVGGTDYYSEIGIEGVPVGLAELEGTRNTRIFDPETNTWTQSGSMTYGRWYPSLVTLPDSKVFVASGVTKLIKPVYPQDPINSGRNVVQTETYDPCAGEWTENPASAHRSLPLYPRFHLLPNGHVLYNGGGQAFNPFGQGYDQALWNIAATYDPENQDWTDIGFAGLPLRLDELGLGQLTSTANITNLNPEQLAKFGGELVNTPTGLANLLTGLNGDLLSADTLQQVVGGGMRGSASSTLLPIQPGENGDYSTVEILTAGGVPSYALLTNPGGYLPTDISRIDTVVTDGDEISYESRITAPLNRPRWYGTTVVMPDGSVTMLSGGDRDGVVGPGLEGPIRMIERFDPATSEWSDMTEAVNARTYHNTATLMPDGRVMIAGHSPINTAYLSFIDFSAFGLAPYSGRDPSFEIYSPAYTLRNDRPVITDAPSELVAGETFTISVDQAEKIDYVQIMRRTVMTHLIDGDQRAIVLPVLKQEGNKITLKLPDNYAVIPAGAYMLFASKTTPEGRVPSKSAAIQVNNPDLTCKA